MAREPGYCLHKPTGQAYVRFSGKLYYLGTYGSAESKERYSRLKAEWLVGRHTEKFAESKGGSTIAQVCLAYLEFAERYYAASSEYVNLKLAVQPLSDLYATLPASEFGVVQFRAVRDWWLNKESEQGVKLGTKKRKADPDKKAKRVSRQYVNKQMKRLTRIIKWSVGEGLVPSATHEAIKCVASLKRGRTDAPETEPVKPVASKLVEATLPFLTQVVADMVRFQRLTGCRPGEVCAIKPAMVNRSESVWTIELGDHKTAYRGKSRTLYVGPQAQHVLRPYLLRSADAHCFSPQESEQQRLDAKHSARKTPLSCGNRPGTNRTRKPRKTPGTYFTSGTYARSIKNVCQRCKLESWAPNQLRHSAATEIRKRFGIDAASIILGHSGLEVTQVYAEADRQKAIDIARQIG